MDHGILIVGASLFLAGCATVPGNRVVTPSVDEVRITMRPSEVPVRLVAKRPRRDSYSFVGRVRAVARDGEFVVAARRANETLRRKARSLGADVVKIEIVSISDRDNHVVMSGRAYRPVN